MSALRRLLLGGYALSLQPHARRFAHAIHDTEEAQASVLQRVLRNLAGTETDTTYKLPGLRDVRAFQDAVPTTTYDEVAPHIDRMAAGERDVLVPGCPDFFEPTSGGGRARKLIPYTPGLLQEFNLAIRPWLGSLLRMDPLLRSGTHYWSISPRLAPAEHTPSGIPIGLPDDTGYLGGLAGRVVRSTLAVGPETSRITEPDTWRHETAVGLLGARDLGLVSVWSPTFLSSFLDHIERNLDDLILDLTVARRRALREARDAAGGVRFERVWPHLSVVSMWTHGPAAAHEAAIRRRLPQAAIQPKGLMATEGAVSFPWLPGADPVAAITSHFLEFVALEDPERRPLLAHQLTPGHEYTLLLTTSGGLVRYRLPDVVRCTGHIGTAPTLVFQGRIDRTSDLCGEKLNAHAVESALDDAVRSLGHDTMTGLLTPALRPRPHYALFLPNQTAQRSKGIAAALESRLTQHHHYQQARRIGQLDAVRARVVPDLEARIEAHWLSRGQRPGDIKPDRFVTTTDWYDALAEDDRSAEAAAKPEVVRTS